MPKYLVKASYNPAGAQGLLAEGGSARRDALTASVESVGGSVETFLSAFGGDDRSSVMDVPDNVSAAGAVPAVPAAHAAGAATRPG